MTGAQLDKLRFGQKIPRSSYRRTVRQQRQLMGISTTSPPITASATSLM
jgi:hypothetical protein